MTPPDRSRSTAPTPNRLAPFAVSDEDSGGRVHPEPDDPLRTSFEVDQRRILTCTAFRRLSGKTQVFDPHAHDHFRTRLTHTLEAAAIARTLARVLNVNATLAEAIALAHDLGHPPFGHAGEVGLNKAMAESGGFNHNAHSLRVVTFLEHPYPAFRGLNLTRATLAGLSTHETIYDVPAERGAHRSGVGSGTRASAEGNEDGESKSSIESQIASLADRIAYDCHDLEDAIGAGYVEWSDLNALAIWSDAAQSHFAITKPIENAHAVRRAVLDGMIDHLIADAAGIAQSRLADRPNEHGHASVGHATRGSGSHETVRVSDEPIVGFSSGAQRRLHALEDLLVTRLHRNRAVSDMDRRGEAIVLALFAAYRAHPDQMPERFVRRLDEMDHDRVICDFLAGMTDRYCRREYERLCH